MDDDFYFQTHEEIGVEQSVLRDYVENSEPIRIAVYYPEKKKCYSIDHYYFICFIEKDLSIKVDQKEVHVSI